MFIGTVIKQFSIKEGLQDQSVIHFHLESPTMKTLLIAFVLLVVTLATAAPAAKQKMAEVCLFVHAVSLIGK